ncbi:FUSC family protein [Flavobacteriales bacterium 34_180_T64]|nr:FUSC family protein [Flavobacteriales bacterium 34_180_T64]
MRKLFIILGFITSIIAVVFAVTPLSNLAVAPGLMALVCGLVVLFYSKKQVKSRKVIQYIFLLTIIALTITIYKAVFNTAEVGDIQKFEETEKVSEEEAIEDLEGLNLDDIELD